VPVVKEGLFGGRGGFVHSVSESFIFQFTRLLINRSVSTAPFGDLFRNMNPCPAQHAIYVFPVKGPLETKLCSFISWKCVAFQTLNFACRFLLCALQSHKLLEESERSTLASSTTLMYQAINSPML